MQNLNYYKRKKVAKPKPAFIPTHSLAEIAQAVAKITNIELSFISRKIQKEPYKSIKIAFYIIAKRFGYSSEDIAKYMRITNPHTIIKALNNNTLADVLDYLCIREIKKKEIELDKIDFYSKFRRAM